MALNIFRAWGPITFPLVLGFTLWSGEASAITPSDFWLGTAVAGGVWVVAEVLHAGTADRTSGASERLTMAEVRAPWHERPAPRANCLEEPRWTWEVWRDS
jgi:hypothetical protein